jgi:hypothetical protein
MVRTFIARAKVSLAVRYWSRSSFSVLIFSVRAAISSWSRSSLSGTPSRARRSALKRSLKVGVLVGELVALQAGLFCERDYVEPA